jgi:hypothetical protein
MKKFQEFFSERRAKKAEKLQKIHVRSAWHITCCGKNITKKE